MASRALGDGLLLRHVGGLPVGFRLGGFGAAFDCSAYVYAFGGRIEGDGREGFAAYGLASVFVGNDQLLVGELGDCAYGLREAGEQGEVGFGALVDVAERFGFEFRADGQREVVALGDGGGQSRGVRKNSFIIAKYRCA